MNLNFPLFSVFEKEVTLLNLLLAAAGLGAIFFFYRRTHLSWLKYSERLGIDDREKQILKTDLFLAFVLLAPAILMKTLDLPDQMSLSPTAEIGFSEILFLLGFVQIARLIDHFIGAVLPTFLSEFQSVSSKTQSVRFIAYTLGGLWFVSRTGHNWTLFSVGDRAFRVSNILAALLVFFCAKLGLFLLRRFALARLFKTENLDAGAQFSINRLLSYVIYVFAAVLIFQSLGIEMTVIWGSAAALLVGAGLGLREAVNDFISGVILLFEKTVRVGDQIEVQGQLGVVQRIGFRTSLLETRDKTTVIVPNSKLFSDKVLNFHGETDIARFKVAVRVAFDSDIDLVKKLLLDASENQTGLLVEPPAKVRVVSFYEFGVELELLFFTHDFDGLEDLKSALRIEILKKMQAAGVRFGYENFA